MLLFDTLIAYAPSPVKPLLYFARRFPLGISLGVVAVGLLAAHRAETATNAAETVLSAQQQQSRLTADDVAMIGWVVAALGSLFPGYQFYGVAKRLYVLCVYKATCDAIRAALTATVQKSGGLVYAAVQYRGVVIDYFEKDYAVTQADDERIDMSVEDLRAEYRRLSGSIDSVVRLCGEAVRETRQGHMVRLILDVLHGGVLYEQVSGRTYVMGCVVNQRYMESVSGEHPRANRDMAELVLTLKQILNRSGGDRASTYGSGIG